MYATGQIGLCTPVRNRQKGMHTTSLFSLCTIVCGQSRSRELWVKSERRPSNEYIVVIAAERRLPGVTLARQPLLVESTAALAHYVLPW